MQLPRPRRLVPASLSALSALALGVAGVGCDNPEVNPFAPPAAALTASPTEGIAPHAVTLDASASTSNGALQYRFDVDGDGTFDTEFASAATLDFTFEAPGEFTAVVEVQDEEGRTSQANADIAIVVHPALADLDVDVNRDGDINIDDKEGEDTFTAARGAMMVSNLDDDDNDGERDIIDEEIDGRADQLEMATVVLQASPGLLDDDIVTLQVAPTAAQQRIRIFEAGSGRVLSSPFDDSFTAPTFDVDELRSGSITLYVESVGRTTSWDGRLTLTLEVERDGNIEASDEVLLTAAPVIFPDNIRRADELFIMRISDFQFGTNMPFFNHVNGAMPPGVNLYAVDQYSYYGDRWLQDNMQAGYQEIARGDDVHRIFNYLETERWAGGQGLEMLLPNELLGPDFGFSYPQGEASSLNYGGNLEVGPPHDGYPFGRLLYGGGDEGTILGRSHSDTMNPDQLGWLDAQEVQGPSVELSSEWLIVGHIDEIFLFVPDHRTVAEGGTGKNFKVMFASPDLAIQKLEELEANGNGNVAVFAGRETSRTVSQILDDDEQLSYNTAVQTRIDSIRLKLMDAMNLTDDDVIEVPVMYESEVYQGRDFAVAHNPGIQNLIVVDGEGQDDGAWFIPDPEGPVVGGVDQWQQMVTDVSAPLGARLEYVDVFESYHLLYGEAHCGSNVRRVPFSSAWWTQ